MAASLSSRCPVCPGIELRHRLRAQVEVNQRVRGMPHVKTAVNLSQFTKIWPQFWSGLDKVSRCDIGTQLTWQVARGDGHNGRKICTSAQISRRARAVLLAAVLSIARAASRTMRR